MNSLTSDCGFYWLKSLAREPVEHDERFSIGSAVSPLMVSDESQPQNTFVATRLPERLTVAVSESIAVPETVAPEPVALETVAPEVIAVQESVAAQETVAAPDAASCVGLSLPGTSPVVKKQIPEQLHDICQQWLALSHRFPKDLSFQQTGELVEAFREILLQRLRGLASEPSRSTTGCQPSGWSSTHHTKPADQKNAPDDSSQRDHQLVDHFWLSYLNAISRRITQISSDDVRVNGQSPEEPNPFTFEQLNQKSWDLYARIGVSYPDNIPLILKQASYPLSHGGDTFAIIHSVVFQGVEASSNFVSTLLFSLCEYYQPEQRPSPNGSEPVIIRLFEQLGYWRQQNDKLIVPKVKTAKGEIRPMSIVKSMERIIPKEHPFQQALARVQLDSGPIGILDGSVTRQKKCLKQTIKALASSTAADDLAKAKQRPSPAKTQRKQKKDNKTTAPLSCNQPAAPSTPTPSEAGKNNSGECLSTLADNSSSPITFARQCKQLINADNVDLLKKLLTDNPQLFYGLKQSQKNKIDRFLKAKKLPNFMRDKH
ncbi:hypothetical protein [Endozoicomonas sp. ALC013]|uniref:hypothetical protein n=1 Tax=Endozoicomonas sp. ALC013 TaxID=3403076 RepID=UPI003BB5C092